MYIYGLCVHLWPFFPRKDGKSFICDASKCCCKSLAIDLNGLSCFDPWKKNLIFNNTNNDCCSPNFSINFGDNSMVILVFIYSRYCKAVYPTKDIRNIVEANDRVLVDGSLVLPYRCLG